MSDWLEQYSAALDVRDAREQAHKPYIDAYTRLADRTAGTGAPSTDLTTSTPRPVRTATPTKPPKGQAAPTTQAPSDHLSTLRADLATTQKARATLQTRVEALTASLAAQQSQSQLSTAETAQLKKQKADLERKLRDREEEIRGKASLVDRAQDEMVALEMQLNLSEERKGALEAENKELVKRWMVRAREEAERVNRDSRWE